MKKLLFFGLVLSLGLSSCGFGPIPGLTDYPYHFMAFDDKGVLLCTPVPDYMGYNHQNLVDAGITSANNQVVVPNTAGAKAVVKIKSTLPYWLALQADGILSTGDLDAVRPDLDEDGNLTNVYTIKDGDNILFTVTCPKPVRELFGFELELPLFDGDIVIERVKTGFTGTVRFYVAGNDIWEVWTDCVWTGFEIKFE